MAAPRSGNPDRGWNDPPMFDYQSAAPVQSSPRRHLLNKRVAFPATNQTQKVTNTNTLNPGEGPPPLPVHILPPATNTATPTPVPVLIPSLALASSKDTTHPNNTNKKEESNSLPAVLERLKLPSDLDLMNFVKQTFDLEVLKCTNKLQSRVIDDVNRKLELFTEIWSGGHLSETVKCRMGEMAEEMKAGNYEKAWSLHLGLMVDHTAEVNHWLVGIKRIIHELKGELKNEKSKESVFPENILISCVSNKGEEIEQGTDTCVHSENSETPTGDKIDAHYDKETN